MSSYYKNGILLEVDEEGIFKGKFHNGTVNGIAIDLKILSFDVDITDWHLNAGIGIAIPFTKNKFGVNADLGFNNKTFHPEINASVYHADDKTSRDYGLKVSTDIINGLVGGYIRNTSSVPVDKNTVQKSINETGFQILNIPSVAAVAISIVAYKAIVAGSAIKLAFAGGSALWVAIVNYFNGGGQK